MLNNLNLRIKGKDIMIEIKDVTKKYGSTVILEHTSYCFPKKGLVCLIGPSGGGKTTLLNLLSGFDTKYQGEILINGIKINTMSAEQLCNYRKNNIGFIFQNYHLLRGYTVLDNLLLAGSLSNEEETEIILKAQTILKQLKILEKEKEAIENLSGGQKQRVAIARALINEPQIIFGDEPTGALDRANSTEIMKLLKEISLEKLVIVITHDKKVCEFADEVISIKEHKIVIEHKIVEKEQIIIQKKEIIGEKEITEEKKIVKEKEITENKKKIEEERRIKEKAIEKNKSIVEQNKNIVGQNTVVQQREKSVKFIEKSEKTTSVFVWAVKNFKVHLKQYFAVSFAISIGILAFLFSLSFGNVINRSIEEFQAKNTAFNHGYIKENDNGTILELLKADERIEHVFYQYILEDVKLTLGEVTEVISEKLPMPKASESLSYGIMPRREKKEISLTPSLAKKFSSDIQTLIGQEMIVEVNQKNYSVRISGIYNAAYDDFFVSSDIEEEFYKKEKIEENFSISYEVKEFSDILTVNEWLKQKEIYPISAEQEVAALQKTFDSLSRLFFLISVLILGIGLFICIVLLVKLANSRCREIGILSALGYNRGKIGTMILQENMLLSSLAAIFNLFLLLLGFLVGKLTKFPFTVDYIQTIGCAVLTFLVVLFVSKMAGKRLLHTEPAEALRM